ncbi:phytoene/squalene synthase family protein [Peteryoungia ipomoeae]|uniref:Phytoene/squalene synthase family protein n=1 Tax=Peteryoungia ipomoeae TaxID=1210932 RepID=A0A4S8P5B6_9HYPH|nr:phytoene/squalene synthase family protein [Peteryoungia ipomoeae]THV25373.1 phytoene/squalene synthase family protein [Peteryoungia ipomoeae]
MASGAPEGRAKPSSNADICLETLRLTDSDRYLACLLTPPAHRAELAALYAYNAELSRVRDVTREAMTGEVRLQYWRDLLEGQAHGETNANPIAAELLRTVAERKLPVDALVRMADARIFDLYDDPMESTAMFEGYAGETASGLIQLASLALDAGAAADASEIAGHAGVAQLVAGCLLLLPLHMQRGQVYLPQEILTAVALDRDTFLQRTDPARLSAAIEAFAGYGLDHLQKARRAGRIPKSLVAAYLPLASTERILTRARRIGGDMAQRDARPAQWRRQMSMLRLLVTGRL